ncbi:tyrosine-type recombinase/integrase [Acidihalobacter ferrooxydans]|uniref:Tyr recombinase domain-containing protein n=1 Tax=Acidihalobacter ferrooxydans TaxID=1765967 RepID=A0A1P8UGJ3_9GAMM|nr:site-specific integrase [Acidihalobacter ferrooxydans]APZ42930.1 hypothetical protein BW247_07350 [Acidihalobacter ferrooxydans]
MVRYLRETQPWKRAAERDLSIARILQPHFSGAVMNTHSAKHIHSYIEARRSLGRKDSTIRRELGMLSAAINYARRQWEWNPPNPVMGRKPPMGEHRVRWITPKEAARLIQAAKGNSHAPLLADFIELALHTGCRRDELLRLEWNRVDLAQRLVYLPSGKNKGKRNVSVPLNEAAMAIQDRLASFRKKHCKTSPWVFCHKDGERLQSVKKSFSTAVSKAGLEDFHIHDLRHTCAAWLVQAGVALVEVRELLRHTTVQVTEKYAHLNPQQSRNAVSVLDRMSRFGHAGGEVATEKTTKSLKNMVVWFLPKNHRNLLIFREVVVFKNHGWPHSWPHSGLATPTLPGCRTPPLLQVLSSSRGSLMGLVSQTGSRPEAEAFGYQRHGLRGQRLVLGMKPPERPPLHPFGFPPATVQKFRFPAQALAYAFDAACVLKPL